MGVLFKDVKGHQVKDACDALFLACPAGEEPKRGMLKGIKHGSTLFSVSRSYYKNASVIVEPVYDT